MCGGISLVNILYIDILYKEWINELDSDNAAIIMCFFCKNATILEGEDASDVMFYLLVNHLITN